MFCENKKKVDIETIYDTVIDKKNIKMNLINFFTNLNLHKLNKSEKNNKKIRDKINELYGKTKKVVL